MASHDPSRPHRTERTHRPDPPGADRARLAARARALVGLALRRLPSMIDERSGLCVQRVDRAALAPSGQSVRYTAIVVIGLARAEQANLSPHLDRERLLAAIDRALPSLTSSGDLALALWAAARDARPIAERALAALEAFGPPTARRGGDTFHATELAWLITGLCEALERNIGDERRVRSFVDLATAHLASLRGPSGLYAFSRPANGPGLLSRLRGRLGFFDAQVYSIAACCRRHEVLCAPDALPLAQQTARALLREQAERGQWPWHWDARTGRVVDLYPVYSVHQHGMAPMALLPLERLSGLRATHAIARGIDWLFGHNELGVALANTARDVCWRSIRRRPPLGRVVMPLKAVALAGVGSHLYPSRWMASPRLLAIDHELRPYELGWCLYGLSNLAAESRAQSAA